MTAIPTRREFTQAMAVLALASAPAAAQKAAIPDAKSYTAAVETIIRYKFGRQLTDEQLKRVQSSYMGKLSSGDLLKRVPLNNSEDPIEAFRAD